MNKELEALEYLKLAYQQQTNIVIELCKAIDIIKDKQVVIPRLLCWKGLNDYNYPLLPKYRLEQEEYEFLKKIFDF